MFDGKPDRSRNNVFCRHETDPPKNEARAQKEANEQIGLTGRWRITTKPTLIATSTFDKQISIETRHCTLF